MTIWERIRRSALLIELLLLAVIAVGVWRLQSLQPCQIAIRDRSGYWPRGADGLCHVEDLQALTPSSSDAKRSGTP